MKTNNYKKFTDLAALLSFYLCVSFAVPVFSAQYNGILYYPQAVELTSPTTGIILNASPTGRYYLKSQQLLSFDSIIIKSQISTFKSKLASQQKIYSEAKQELLRSKELYDASMLSDHELKVAEIGELTEKSQLDNIKTQLLKKQWELKYYQLKAPFNGFIVATNILAEQYVNNRFNAVPLLKFVAAYDIIFYIKLRNSQLSSESKIMDLKTGDRIIIKNSIDKEKAEKISFTASYLSFIEEQDNKLFIFKLAAEESSYSSITLPLDFSLVSLLIE